MTSINEKLGIKRAGKRAMMKLPDNRVEASAITSATCPVCGGRYARASSLRDQAGYLWCTWCNHTWKP